MKITFLLPFAGISGGIRVVALYAERLRRRGHDITIISMPHWLHNRKALIRDFFSRRLVMKAKGQEDPSFLRGLDVDHRVLDRNRPVVDGDVPDADVVVATWWETAEWAAALSPRKGAKVYFLQGYDAASGQPVDRVKATWQLPFHKIAVSKWLADMARGEFDDNNVSLVPNSVDVSQFQSPPRGKQTIPTVGTVYSNKSYRGCKQVFEAVELAAKKIENLKLLTFGIGPEDKTNLPLPARGTHHTMPPQEQLPQLYSQCDAWLWGSEAEGFGLPILEAFACRTPVIATHAGAAPELVAPDDHGRMPGALVNYNNIDEMADAIVTILTQPEADWKKMSQAAFEVAQSYTWDDATDLFEEALMTVVNKNRKHVAVSSGR